VVALLLAFMYIITASNKNNTFGNTKTAISGYKNTINKAESFFCYTFASIKQIMLSRRISRHSIYSV